MISQVRKVDGSVQKVDGLGPWASALEVTHRVLASLLYFPS